MHNNYSVAVVAIAIPGGDAASQDALHCAPVEAAEDWRL